MIMNPVISGGENSSTLVSIKNNFGGPFHVIFFDGANIVVKPLEALATSEFMMQGGICLIAYDVSNCTLSNLDPNGDLIMFNTGSSYTRITTLVVVCIGPKMNQFLID